MMLGDGWPLPYSRTLPRKRSVDCCGITGGLAGIPSAGAACTAAVDIKPMPTAIFRMVEKFTASPEPKRLYTLTSAVTDASILVRNLTPAYSAMNTLVKNARDYRHYCTAAG